MQLQQQHASHHVQAALGYKVLVAVTRHSKDDLQTHAATCVAYALQHTLSLIAEVPIGKFAIKHQLVRCGMRVVTLLGWHCAAPTRREAPAPACWCWAIVPA